MKNDDWEKRTVSRRKMISFGLPLAMGTMGAMTAFAAPVAVVPMRGVRSLSLTNRHTGESVSADYWVDGWYHPDALAEINHVMRDFRTDEVQPIDRELLDLLYQVRTKLGSDAGIEFSSAYRSPKTNAALRRRHRGVARNSLHMQGKAIDIRLPGQRLRNVRNAAKSLRAGGVGYYPRSGFVHLDVGTVRYWS